MRALAWLVRAFIFFALFAFALNNQQEVTLHWFFGLEWRASMVIVVLCAFAIGCAVGAVAMVPSWWRQRRVARLAAPSVVVPAGTSPSTQAPSAFGAEATVPARETL
jgi:putative membrane protein